jgi:hypothetical protein
MIGTPSAFAQLSVPTRLGSDALAIAPSNFLIALPHECILVLADIN